MLAGRNIAVVIPCYRVEKQIAGVLERMPGYVDHVIAVNDASPDDLASLLASRAGTRLTVLTHATNRGVGGAMATGFKEALRQGADVVVKCDGDGQMDPCEISRLLEPLLDGSADYAKGCRFHHSRELIRMPWARRAGNVCLTLLMKLASGYWHVMDPQNGFVAVARRTLERLELDRLSRGYFFENDMLIRLNAIEARVADVPLPARYGDESSSMSLGRILLGFPGRLLAGFFRRVYWRYVFYDVSPVAVFLLFGLVLFSFGFAFGAYHWIRSLLEQRLTPAGTIMVAAVPLILGFQLLLQAIVLDVTNSPRPANGVRSAREREDGTNG